MEAANALDQLINLCISKEASDIHFGEGRKPSLRLNRKIVFVEGAEPYSQAEAGAMVALMLTDEEKKRLERMREVDFAYTHKTGVSFRVNAYYQRGRLAAAMRMIPKHIPTLEELGIPAQVREVLQSRKGLVLVAGPAGSGKSTTVQAMLQFINENAVEHILTIENPVEHLFEDQKSIFSQREVGKDTLTYVNGLQAAVREDANVVMVSEIASLEVLEQVLTLVETGHLVIGSFLAEDVTQALEKLAGFAAPAQQKYLQTRLSEALLAVLAQDLAERADLPGRVAVFELMMPVPSIRNIIRRGNFAELRTAIQSHAQEGMITLDAYAYRLAEQGIISEESVKPFMESEE